MSTAHHYITETDEDDVYGTQMNKDNRCKDHMTTSLKQERCSASALFSFLELDAVPETPVCAMRDIANPGAATAIHCVGMILSLCQLTRFDEVDSKINYFWNREIN